MSQSCYLFTREQLLRAIEAHAETLDTEAAERMRITVLAFIDGPAAKANGLQFTPSPIGTEPSR
jgi:hypothetical protein